MSLLGIRLVAWNASGNPTRTQVTATVAYSDGVACGHSNGVIWLYDFESSASKDISGPSSLQLRPKCLLSAHRSRIVLMKLAEISSPTVGGRESTVISISEDGDVVLWSALDGRCISRVRTPLQGIRPTALSLQTIDHQLPCEDLLFVSGEGGVVYVLSYPSLELAYEWQFPHTEWITALTARKRRDHLRSEIITCTRDGVVRVWSYDEFALAQQNVFSRAASPVENHATTRASSAPADTAQSMSTELETDPAREGSTSSIFNLDAQFAALGEGDAMLQLLINPFNEDEFLAVSPKVARLFASRNGDLHELLVWHTQRTADSTFTGGGFLGKSDIVLWDSIGTIFSACTLFSVEGGSAGMHTARAKHVDNIKGPVHCVSGLSSVPQLSSKSALAGLVSCTTESRVDVLVSYASGRDSHMLSVVVPVPLSSVSGSANRPHQSPEDAISGPRNWLGKAVPFDMSTLWNEWIKEVKIERGISSALVTNAGDLVVVGYCNGTIVITSPALLIDGLFGGDGDTEGDIDTIELCGHTAAITALYEWQPLADSVAAEVPVHDSLGIRSQEYGKSARKPKVSSLLISASKDLTMRIWNMGTGECLYVIPAQSSPVVSIHSMSPTRTMTWKESVRHRELSELLSSLVLAVESGGSTALVSVTSFERLHVTPPYHEPPVRIALCRDSGDLELQYADDFQQQLSLSHFLRADDNDDGQYPECIINLAQSTMTPYQAPGNNNGGNGCNEHGWISVKMISQNGHSLKWPGSGALACVIDIDIGKLQTSVSKVVVDESTEKEMRRLVGRSDVRGSLQLLSRLCTWGVSKELDVAKRGFGLRPPHSNVTLSMTNNVRETSTMLFPNHSDHCASWCVSRVFNAQRMLAILVLARGALHGRSTIEWVY
ncbi:hypothetical protein COEREDRAFT_83162 [Coemansia reversa NRRL 1564]|uniref:WD40 repeat-like protein n=1 Tax=Coemansia reversa (strain ATCC 12441 / NRRL 1564) TaxID=763665 RepID=A0A2G5B4A0_COERN|nr:hypothetical protein COEREDRAFT_83162 [Coemansia reversa NRRL 1564]|eukprot:PIA13873.1 hypothetical protein COEREDRAFT_83162 [Coemansia reversa NRRL 1564]